MSPGGQVSTPGEECPEPRRIGRGTPFDEDRQAIGRDVGSHRDGPGSIDEVTQLVAQLIEPLVCICLGKDGRRLERHHRGVRPIGIDGSHVFNRDAIHLADLAHEYLQGHVVGHAYYELVDRTPTATLEDLNAHHVAAHASNTARHLTEGTWAIGQPDPHDERIHVIRVTIAEARDVATM